MYCSKCGKHIGDNDRFCSGCGSKVEPPAERIISNSSYGEGSSEEHKPYTLDTSEFVWDIDEFKHEHKVPEEVKVDWQQGIVTELGKETESQLAEPAAEDIASKDSEISELEAIKARLKAEEEKLREVREAAERLHAAELKKKALEAEKAAETQGSFTQERKTTEVPRAAERTQEYHFKFVPADEAEYEHIHKPEVQEEGEVFERVTLDDISEDVEVTSSPSNSAMKRDTARLDKFYTFNKKNEEFQKLLDKEYERVSSGKGGDTELDYMFGVQEDKHEEPEVFDPVAHLKAAEEARKAALGGSEKYMDDSIVDLDRRFDTTELEKDLMESAQFFEEDGAGGVSSDKNSFSSVALGELFGAALDDAAEKANETNEDNRDSEKAAYDTDSMPGRNMSFTMELDKLFSDTDDFEEPKKEKKAKKKKLKKQDNLFTDGSDESQNEIENLYGDDGYGEKLGRPAEYSEYKDDDYDDDEDGRGIAGKVLLIVIIAILVLELAVLGIKYFAPDSSAAQFINNRISDVVTFFSEIGKSDDDGGKDIENDGAENEDEDVQGAQVSGDINAVIQEKMNLYNKNIEMIMADSSLAYSADAKYGSDSVHNSKPISDNTLYTGADGTVYFADSEAIGALIAFDSGWIDYVNSRDEAVFDVIKKDSNAYKNCTAFNQNVKKEFKTLKIGEIRQDDKGYYIWARETIETTSGGKTTSDDFNWVYYMEPENEKLLVVDYYKF